MVVGAVFELAMWSDEVSAEPNVNDYVQHLGDGQVEIGRIPVLYLVCGMPVLLSEPLENGKTHLYEGRAAIEGRLDEYSGMKQPFLSADLSEASEGTISCGMPSLPLPIPNLEPKGQQFPDFSNSRKPKKYTI